MWRMPDQAGGEAMKWEPIETAPKDGAAILVYAQCLAQCAGEQLEPFITVCSFHPDAGFCVCEIREATHWMPLPEPPTTETQ
jgi:hypothetical protein